jgi:membrane-associated phospholipid phosphatase
LAQRTERLNRLADLVGQLAGARVVVVVALTEAVVAVAVTGSRRPALFVAVAVAGEAALYLAVSQLVGRPRPPVPDLVSDLPAQASFPSGHVGAAVAVYGAFALLVLAYSASRPRWLVLVLPSVVVPAVGVSRVYEAAHRPSDVIAGLLLGTAWLLAASTLLGPGPGRDGRA